MTIQQSRSTEGLQEQQLLKFGEFPNRQEL